MKMNEPPEIQRMGNADIILEICAGRSCAKCPLLKFPQNCIRLPREVIVDAYCKVFDVSKFEVTEEELMNIIGCE